ETEDAAGDGHGNYKSILQQLAQRQLGDTPKYRVLDEQGPDHNKCFKVSAEIARHYYPAAWGANKKDAEQKAAMNALASIRGEEVPFPADFCPPMPMAPYPVLCYTPGCDRRPAYKTAARRSDRV